MGSISGSLSPLQKAVQETGPGFNISLMKVSLEGGSLSKKSSDGNFCAHVVVDFFHSCLVSSDMLSTVDNGISFRRALTLSSNPSRSRGLPKWTGRRFSRRTSVLIQSWELLEKRRLER